MNPNVDGNIFRERLKQHRQFKHNIESELQESSSPQKNIIADKASMIDLNQFLAISCPDLTNYGLSGSDCDNLNECETNRTEPGNLLAPDSRNHQLADIELPKSSLQTLQLFCTLHETNTANPGTSNALQPKMVQKFWPKLRRKLSLSNSRPVKK